MSFDKSLARRVSLDEALERNLRVEAELSGLMATVEDVE